MAAGVHLAVCLHAPRFSLSLFACRPRRSPLAVCPSQFFPRWSPLAVRPSQFSPRPSMSLQEFHTHSPPPTPPHKKTKKKTKQTKKNPLDNIQLSQNILSNKAHKNKQCYSNRSDFHNLIPFQGHNSR